MRPPEFANGEERACPRIEIPSDIDDSAGVDEILTSTNALYGKTNDVNSEMEIHKVKLN